jgi:hypothetical protein
MREWLTQGRRGVEYGTSKAYGNVTTTATVANESGEQSEIATLSGLEACTTYHYQAEAENKANEEEKSPGLGGDETFQTGGCVATGISAGYSESCALLVSDSIDCWGAGTNGQLGDGTFQRFDSRPAAVSDITSATSVSVGAGDVCAVIAGGAVNCWGRNGYGELGDGTTEESALPVAVEGITSATQVSAGGDGACAVLSSGGVDCWGENFEGALGDGLTTGPEECPFEPESSKMPCSTVPTAVSGISNAVEVAVAGRHACARLSGGHIECWGDNLDGDLGDGSEFPPSTTPVSVGGITNAAAVSVGWPDSCALLAGGTIDCWGSNLRGNLGDGSTINSSTPAKVSGITNATSVSADESHACARLATGQIDCWGENAFEQLGDGTHAGPETCWGEPCSETPVEVNGITNATAVSAGGYHNCALLPEGHLECWGKDYWGELGNGVLVEEELEPFPPGPVLGFP